MSKFWLTFAVLIEAEDYEEADTMTDRIAFKLKDEPLVYDVSTSSPEEETVQ